MGEYKARKIAECRGFIVLRPIQRQIFMNIYDMYVGVAFLLLLQPVSCVRAPNGECMSAQSELENGYTMLLFFFLLPIYPLLRQRCGRSRCYDRDIDFELESS